MKWNNNNNNNGDTGNGNGFKKLHVFHDCVHE